MSWKTSEKSVMAIVLIIFSKNICIGSLEVNGGHWRSLKVIGGHWRSLEVIGGHWRSLEVIGGRLRSIQGLFRLFRAIYQTDGIVNSKAQNTQFIGIVA